LIAERTGSDPKKSAGCSPKVGALGDIDVETCEQCGGSAKVIPNAFTTLTGQDLACIDDQQVIDKILFYLRKKDRLPSHPGLLPEARVPPQTSLVQTDSGGDGLKNRQQFIMCCSILAITVIRPWFVF